MRNERTSRDSRVISLADVAANIGEAAVRTAAPADVMDAGGVSIPAHLHQHAIALAEGALKGSHPVDPLLDLALSRLVSTCCSAVKRSGPLIEKALIAALERNGFLVLAQVAMPISEAARSLIDLNDADVLRKISVRHDVAAAKMMVFDMVVYDVRRRTAMLVEVKRGNGPTELRKVTPATRDLRAGALQLKSFLRAKGLGVRKVRAVVVDYYGRSGFSDEIRVTGDRLNHAFRCDVTSLIEAVIDVVRTRIWQELPAMIAKALHGAPQVAAPAILDIGDGIRVDARYASAIEPEPRRRSAVVRNDGNGKSGGATQRSGLRIVAGRHGNAGSKAEHIALGRNVAAS